MSVLIGYLIPGSTHGQALNLPDDCLSLAGESDADNMVARVRRECGMAWAAS